MDFHNFFYVFIIFLILFSILKRSKLLIENVSYSSHKILGSENRSPVIIGGLFILITIVIFSSISINLKIVLTLITFLGLLSDRNILPNPKIRLLIQVIILFLIVYIDSLKIQDLRYEPLNFLLSNDIFNLSFTVFCLAILLNGSNFLDGLNGLVAGYYLVIIISLLILKSSYPNIILIDENYLKLLITILIIFFVFNILGLTYLGDSGSYAISLLIGVYLIKFYSLNPLVSPYYIAVILWYPAFENLFSLLRRVLKKKNVSNADNYHLHQLLFLFLKSKKNISKKFLNSFSSLIIIFLNLPSIFISIFYVTKTIPLILILIVNISFYIYLYYFFYKNFVKN